MFNIEYRIVSQDFNGISNITESEIHYNFLPGNLSLITCEAKIEIDWEWIPLLDFAYCLQRVIENLKKNDNSKEYFEFTENTETLEFFRTDGQLKIVASFINNIRNHI